MAIWKQILTNFRESCGNFPDNRTGECHYLMADAGLAALSMFFMQSGSFLSHQRALDEGQQKSNCQTLFEMEKIPTDACIRNLLDPVHPEYLQSCFDHNLSLIKNSRKFDAFKVLGGRTLTALDGVQYFCSHEIHCDKCLTRSHKNGTVDYYHTMLAATFVAPGHNHVLPLMPEHITKQDNIKSSDNKENKTQEKVKQDCERNAARRWLEKHGPKMKEYRPIYLGDDLFACQPIAEATLAAGGDFIFTCKRDSHKTLYRHVDEGTPKTFKLNRNGRIFKYEWMEDVPLRGGKDGMKVNWISLTITNKKTGKSTTKSFVTSLSASKGNIVELLDCARARWKIENETFNVLKNNGYNLEHNYGHGKQYLAMLFATMNLLAFGYHTICDHLDELWIKARKTKGSRKRFFEHVRTITVYIVFPSWNAFLLTLITGKPPPGG